VAESLRIFKLYFQFIQLRFVTLFQTFKTTIAGQCEVIIGLNLVCNDWRLLMRKLLRMAGIGAVILAAQCLPSQAVTVGFGGADVDPYIENGFEFDVVNIVNGNCASSPCMKLSPHNTSTLTQVGGGLFSLSSFWFQLLGNPAALTVKSYSGATLIEQIVFTTTGYPSNNGGQTFSHLFEDVTKISFSNTGGGSVRTDDFVLNLSPVSAVPLPAGLPLMISGLVMLGLIRRRKANS
jgi:hypothetical protein